MLPGPDIYYKCPECKSLICNGSNLSGNNFGAKYYSDGKMIAPMFPEYPEITKCYECDNIFWLREENEEYREEYGMQFNIEPENPAKRVRYAKFLSYSQYRTLLKQKKYETRGEEMYLRKNFWWTVNDVIRDKGTSSKKFYEEKKCTENIKALIVMLTENIIELAKAGINEDNDDEIENHTIMIAERHRNLCNFEECRRTLKEIFRPELSQLIELFNKECDKGNNLVFRIERDERTIIIN